LAEFGAFVELFPGTDGLLHISEISEHRIRDVRDELKLGDQVFGESPWLSKANKIRLSRKAPHQGKPAKKQAKKRWVAARPTPAAGSRRRRRRQTNPTQSQNQKGPRQLPGAFFFLLSKTFPVAATLQVARPLILLRLPADLSAPGAQ